MTIIAVNNTDCRNLLKHETALLIRSGDTVMLTVLSKQKRTSIAAPILDHSVLSAVVTPCCTIFLLGSALSLRHCSAAYRVERKKSCFSKANLIIIRGIL